MDESDQRGIQAQDEARPDPDREAWLFQNPAALSMVLRGIEQSRRIRGEYLGSFSQYADIEID